MPDRIDRIEMALDRLTTVVETLAASVTAHDDQIDSLLTAAEKHEAAIANLERQWQAYLSTIHPHQ